MRQITRAMAALTAGLLACASQAQAQNLLANPSFEAAQSVATGWESFGNVFRERVVPVSGDWSIKLFGNFSPFFNVSGLFQTLPASAGQNWQATITGTNISGDALSGGNRALLKIEFYDASNTQIAFAEQIVLDPTSPLDTRITQSVSATSPDGTTSVRVAILFLQEADFAGGAAFFDDVSIGVVGQAPAPLVNASFEEGGDARRIPGWNDFNNAFRTDITPRTGGHSLTVVGGTVSGVFQDFPTTPGEAWSGSVYAYNSSANNPLTAPDFCVANIEWRDLFGNLISFVSSPLFDGNAPLDTSIKMEVSGVAPADAVVARFVLLYIPQGGMGSLQYDDATFAMGAPCVRDFNGDGAVDPDDLSDYISCYFSVPPCPRGDINGDNTTDPDDLSDYIALYFGAC